MQTKKEFCFKGVPLNPGDVIRITPAKGLEKAEGMEMAVLGLNTKTSSLSVLINHENALCIQGPKMELKESEVDCIQVVMEAAEAVPLHSGQIQFRPRERIIYRKGDKSSGGKVIAAFDGYVAAELNNWEIEVSDVVCFNRAPTTALAASSQNEVPIYRT